jgi:hypothetical protein
LCHLLCLANDFLTKFMCSVAVQDIHLSARVYSKSINHVLKRRRTRQQELRSSQVSFPVCLFLATLFMGFSP